MKEIYAVGRPPITGAHTRKTLEKIGIKTCIEGKFFMLESVRSGVVTWLHKNAHREFRKIEPDEFDLEWTSEEARKAEKKEYYQIYSIWENPQGTVCRASVFVLYPISKEVFLNKIEQAKKHFYYFNGKWTNLYESRFCSI